MIPFSFEVYGVLACTDLLLFVATVQDCILEFEKSLYALSVIVLSRTVFI